MGKSNFSRRKCIRALKAIGFTKANTRRGKHYKFYPPSNITIQRGKPEFIMVPRGKLRCQPEILKELRAMGGKKLESSFIENL